MIVTVCQQAATIQIIGKGGERKPMEMKNIQKTFGFVFGSGYDHCIFYGCYGGR